jgi:hypothetical protein
MMALAGQKTITAAATPEIKALSTNTGTISVSDTSAGTAAAWVLAATDPAIYLEVPNLNSVWLKASVDGEGVMWYVTKP